MNSVLLEGYLLTWALLGGALVGAGVTMLWYAWRRRGAAPALTGMAWLLLLAALPVWMRAAGADTGVAWWCATLAVAGLVCIASTRRAAPKRTRAGDRVEDSVAGGLSLASALPAMPPLLWRILVAGPLAFLASLALGLAGYRFGPGVDGDRLFLAATLVIAGWAGLMIWASTARLPGVSAVLMLTVASLLTLAGLTL